MKLANGIIRILAALIALSGTMAAGTANAAFIAYICDDLLCTGGGDTIVVDQGAGDNFPGSAFVGQINEGALNVGGFTIVTNVSQSKPLLGSSALPSLNIQFSATTSDNSFHTIYLYASDTGFTDASGLASLTLGGNQLLPGNGNSISGAIFGGTSNTNLDLSHLIASVSSTASPFALSATGSLTPGVPVYSLTAGVAITRGSAGTTGGGLNLEVGPATTVPEPGSLALLAIGVAGLVTVRRRGRAR